MGPLSKKEIERRRADARIREAVSNAKASRELVEEAGADGDVKFLEGKRYWYWRGTWRDW